ncbi:rRNA processing protein [Coemansia sp. Benny D115]|nr:rRNA processing protein [Coemansia sp. Benny D115]
MPKTKKKQRKTEDFKKVKLKVGKKKAPASNATDTSFTAKAIVVSEQSISTDKSAEATNSRNLTLKDLLSKLRHYSAPVRKEAIVGLVDFLQLHPESLQTELGAIAQGTMRLVVDNEPTVRRSLLRLYSDLLPRVAADLAPFASLMVVFTCSAMTHILEDIRADAVRFLDLLSEVVPAAVGQHAAQILRNFFALLETNTAAGAANARTALLSQSSRLGIMRSCDNYLSVYTRPLLAADPLWFMDAAPRDRALADAYFYPDASAPFAALGLFGEGARAPDAAAEIRAQCRVALERLFPFLQATWMESATALDGAGRPDAKTLELCTQVLRILQTLWRAAYPGGVPHTAADMTGFLRRCMASFPLGAGCIHGDAATEEALLAMNIQVCELAALVRTGLDDDAPVVLAEEADAWAQQASRYVEAALGYRAREPLQTPAPNAHMHAELFAQLLPALWQLARAPGAAPLLVAVTHYMRSCALGSPSKALCIRFLARAIEMYWTNHPQAIDLHPLAAPLTTWALALPKLLWQLRDRNMAATEAATRALRLVCQRTRMLSAEARGSLQATLVPLFCVSVPGKGVVYGPFRAYAPPVQRAVLEAVASCTGSGCSDKLAQAIRACTQADPAPTSGSTSGDGGVCALALEILA